MAKKSKLLAQYFSPEELADELDVCTKTLERWRVQKTGPAITKIGCKTFYSHSAVAAWLRAREQRTNASHGAEAAA